MPPRLPDPIRVLSGKARATIEQLFALIHSANPSDRGLSSREASARYAQKSRLQSLLIRQHADVLEVIADGSDGVVSLRHRLAGRDAAHAVVASLDDDARRWVETELGLGARRPAPAPAPVSTPKRRQAEPGDALALGHVAMAEFGFEAARGHFEAALGTHNIEAGRALVALLVDHLGLDDDALSLVPRLSPSALDDADIVAALALAAARTGDPRAERWARSSRSGDAWAEIAGHAVRTGHLDAAVRAAEAVREVDAAHPALAGLANAMTELRRIARRPKEEALTAAFERGDEAEVNRLLPTVPADAAIVGRIRAHRQHMEATMAAEAASTAYARGDFAGALVQVRRVRELGDDALQAWVAEAESAATQALRTSMLARAHAALAADNLVPYLALDDVARAEVRRERTMPLLDLLERIPDRPGRIAAARALERAMAAPDHIDALAAHAKLLDGVPEYRRLQAKTRARQQQAALDALDDAETAWLAGDLDGAVKRLAALHRPLLPNDRARVDELKRVVAADLSRGESLLRVDSLAQSGDLLGARDGARALGLAERATELDEALRVQWQIGVFDGTGVPLHDVSLPDEDLAPLVRLSGDGVSLYLANGAGEHLFIRVVDTTTALVRTAVALRPPLPPDGVSPAVHGDVLTVFFANGALLQLSTASWEVRRWCPPPARLHGRKVAAPALVAERYVWYTLGLDAESECMVFDLERWPTVVRSGLSGRAVPLLGATVPTVVRLPPEGGIVGHAPNGGARVPPMKLNSFPATRITGVSDDDGDGLLAFGAARALAEMSKGGERLSTNEGTQGVAIVHLRDDGMFRTFEITGMLRTDVLEVASVTAAGRFMVRGRRGAEARLQGGRVGGWDIDGAIDAVVPPSTVFVRDAAARHVRALAWGDDGIQTFDPMALVPSWSMETEANALLDVEGLTAPFSCLIGGDTLFAATLLALQQAAAERNWRGLATATELEPLNLSAMRPTTAQHVLHLRALAALWIGDLPKARAAVRAARAIDGRCALAAITALLDALDEKPAGCMGAYVTRMVLADSHFAHGNPTGARDLLDCAQTWRAFDQQGLARLAAAWLQITPGTPAERFRKRLALATVCEGMNSGVPIPPLTWSEARIAEVREAARRELG